MIEKIYTEARRISQAGLGTVSLGISTYEHYELLGCTYSPPGWHDAQRAVNNGTASPKQLIISQSALPLANTCEITPEVLADLLTKLEVIQ